MTLSAPSVEHPARFLSCLTVGKKFFAVNVLRKSMEVQELQECLIREMIDRCLALPVISGSSCQVPFRPTSGKPVLCSNCFAGKTEGGRSSRGDGSNLEVINSKLDKIIKLLTPKDEMIAKNVITEKILEEIVKKPKKTTKKKE